MAQFDQLQVFMITRITYNQHYDLITIWGAQLPGRPAQPKTPTKRLIPLIYILKYLRKLLTKVKTYIIILQESIKKLKQTSSQA